MIMPAQAIAMLAECVNSTTQLTIAINMSSRGTGSKQKAERMAYAAAFKALTGRKPTIEELEAITR
jgi:hypothetical protein